MKAFPLVLVLAMFTAVANVSADESVRAAQARLKADGFYFNEPSGRLDADTSAAISRYQIRNGLQINGQLDAATAKSLGVRATTASVKPAAPASGSWQQMRKSDRRFLERLESTKPGRKPGQVAAAPPSAAPATRAPAAAPQTRREVSTKRTSVATEPSTGAAGAGGRVLVLSRERLRDYVGAFVLAGLDPRVGAELEFFGDQVAYYNQGTLSRDKIRADLQRYAQTWPERRFWLDGQVNVEPQADSRLRVTFPLRYQLRSGSKRSSGKVRKTMLVEVVGEDLQIVAVKRA
jgi:peptidoglycan hydrolase-like protein with peptidoglycan-binding domain